MSGDFYQGYGIGHGAGVNSGAASVDVESYREAGRIEGRVHEHGQVQAWYVKRLMRHLMARNSQKQALLQELKKYAPDHPYLNPEIVENGTTAVLNEASDPLALQRIQTAHKVSDKHAPLLEVNEVARDALSKLLVDAVGGAETTKGDLAMAADGVAFIAEDSSDAIEDKIQAVYNTLNPNVDEADRRAGQYNKDIKESVKAADAAMKSAEKVAKSEKNERLKAEGVGFLSRLLLNHE